MLGCRVYGGKGKLLGAEDLGCDMVFFSKAGSFWEAQEILGLGF